MLYLRLMLVGLLLGALFGVAFGAFASVFHGGPEAATGVRESWWWFAVAGTIAGFGVAQARAMDAQRRDAPGA